MVYECDGYTLERSRPELVVLPRSTGEVAAVVRALQPLRRPLRSARRRHRALGRLPADRGAGDDLSVAHESHRGDRRREPHRARRSGGGQSRRQRAGGGAWPLLCARSVEPARLHDRRQRGREFGRAAHAQVRRHDEPRALGRARSARRRGRRARRGDRRCVRDTIFAAWSSVRRARSGSSRRRHSACCRFPKACRDPARASSIASTTRARRSRGSSPPGIVPAALEMMDRLIVEAVEAAYHFGFPTDAEAVLIIEIDGLRAGLRTANASESSPSAASTARARCGSPPTRPSAALLWKSRKRAFGAVGRLAPNYCTQDGVVPRTKLPEILRVIDASPSEHRLRIANVFHAGDGNIHPILLYDERDRDEVERVLAAGREILEACVALGGSVTGEHGIGVEKMDLDAAALLRGRSRSHAPRPAGLRSGAPLEPPQDLSRGVGWRRGARAAAAGGVVSLSTPVERDFLGLSRRFLDLLGADGLGSESDQRHFAVDGTEPSWVVLPARGERNRAGAARLRGARPRGGSGGRGPPSRPRASAGAARRRCCRRRAWIASSRTRRPT